MTYEEWGQVAEFARDLKGSGASDQVCRMYADWTADRKRLAEQAAKDVAYVLDQALNMGDGTYKP